MDPPAPPQPTAAPKKPFSRMKNKRHRAPSPLPPPTVFSVRPNPSHYLTSFVSAPPTPEQRVLTLLFEHARRLICVVGLPGTGKTVALRAVAHSHPVHAHFRDAVALLGLAPSTTPASLLADLCELVGRIAGAAPRRAIENRLARNGAQVDAIDGIAAALKHRRVLLLLDNVAEAPNLVLQLVQRLTSVATEESGGGEKEKLGRMAVVASTRSGVVAQKIAGEAVVHVELLPSKGARARDLLSAHLGMPRVDLDRFVGAKGGKREKPAAVVLRRCAGLPLALAVAGGAVKRLLAQDGNKETIWRHYSEYLSGNFEQFGQISRLFANLAACVAVVPKWKWRLKMPPAKAMAALARQPGDAVVTWETLKVVWCTGADGDVAAAVEALASQCLLQPVVAGGVVTDVNVPAIVMDYCLHEARNAGRQPAVTVAKPGQQRAAGAGALGVQAAGVRKSSAAKGRARQDGKAAVKEPAPPPPPPVDSLMSHFCGTSAVFQAEAAAGDKEA